MGGDQCQDVLQQLDRSWERGCPLCARGEQVRHKYVKSRIYPFCLPFYPLLKTIAQQS